VLMNVAQVISNLPDAFHRETLQIIHPTI
jgi:hypothetical protein